MTTILYIIGALSSNTIKDILQKKLLKSLTARDFLFMRSIWILFFLVLLIPFVYFRISFQVFSLMFLVAILAAAGYYLRNNALKHLEISYVTPLFGICPLFVTLFSFIFLQERLTITELIGIIIICFGSYILEVKKGIGILGPWQKLLSSPYNLQAFGTVVLFGVTITLDRYILSNFVSVFTYLFFVWSMISVIFLIFGIRKNAVYKVERRKSFLFSFFPALFLVLTDLCLYTALSQENAGIVSAGFMMNTLIISILGGKFFDEHQKKRRDIAALLITFGGILIALG
ncbi:MAG: hypothetical protein COV59_05440 [Candidatus Magasanikbacteria bacterium CG11_big_fil_rev_8_21_14_0_20_39_34]|uniref:EamA domain-containing protein n=1 Tax=Candidatus Magasanikbacteria bacterium CG11_big_fil_rev_8_21_14_0_20_39_34 TaxID=1974653 RepID=A0A2H0N3Y7_9BACT|nr:MAG: hypothetical protein COV59_05440 [Candidatus Magasanikbacteria bacterium CG11_big_fil_rev_8_21_14_0_20_39_34]